MFKVAWEKTSFTNKLPYDMICKMVRLAYADKTVISCELINDGCSNLNYKIQLKGESRQLILRVYLRDKDAASKEQKLAELIKESVPVPLTYYVGELEGYHFAITEFIHGISLRDLLLSDATYDLSEIMYKVGVILSKITQNTFTKAGFFNKDCEVIQYESFDVIKFIHDCLDDKTVLSVISPDVAIKIKQATEQISSLPITYGDKNLVHGDFDPANIFVDKINDCWCVTGVLDWEFAFSGSYLWDIANMVRYSHKMPLEFQNSFIDALESNGIRLPANWREITYLFNLSSLLDILKRSDPKNHPNKCIDIFDLISHILLELNKMHEMDRIEIKPYSNNWPHIYEKEAKLIQQALADNFVSIHHVGSTAVPGLAAKPKIDIIAVVKNLFFDESQLEFIGYKYRGGFNIPLRKSFTVRSYDRNINLHVFEENDPEIELNILFRDYLRDNNSSRDDYAKLKYKLIAEESSHNKTDSIFKEYTLRKNDFIQNILKKAGFNKCRLALCEHTLEWQAAKYFRDTYFFVTQAIEDTSEWKFNNEKHANLVLYKGTEIIAYAYIKFLHDKRVAIRIIIVDENNRNQSFGSKFVILIEKWLRGLGVKSIHAKSNKTSLRFYLKNGYTKMQLNDQEHDESVMNYIAVGKML